jgi:phenylalanyl-tRNA synthetase beta chain
MNDFPDSRRDVAMLVDSNLTHETVMVVVKKAKPSFLEKVELFDIFKGKGIPEDKKSMAYAFTYRHNERTLTEQEVNNDHQKILESLQSNLHATLR